MFALSCAASLAADKRGWIAILVSMTTGKAFATLLKTDCHHELRECPVCRQKFLLSTYLGEDTAIQMALTKRLRFDHEKNPGNPQPHTDIQL
jgi:hypothetical protein